MVVTEPPPFRMAVVALLVSDIAAPDSVVLVEDVVIIAVDEKK